MKKLLVILLLFFVVGCSKKSGQVFCNVEGLYGGTAFNVKFNQKEQYVIIEGLPRFSSKYYKGKRRNKIELYEPGESYVEISEKKYKKILDILTNPYYETKNKALHKKRKKIYRKWFMSKEDKSSGEFIEVARLNREDVKITNDEIYYEYGAYDWISKWRANYSFSDTTELERFNISRVTGDVKYTKVTRDWDHFKKDYTDPKYETFNGKCSKDRKF